MKLEDLRPIICTDLEILDHTDNFTYKDVDKFGGVFWKLQEREVIGLRVFDNYLHVDIK